ncbi:MAG: hypothetical protein HQL53_05370 [Magnetococcales bacterium]|nr:hypothetical protein [Magnetococcales bacterium]
MKAKLFGIVSVTLMSAALVGTGGYAYHLMNKTKAGPNPMAAMGGLTQTPGGFSVANVPDVDLKEERSIKHLMPRLSQLYNPGNLGGGDIDFRMVGYSERTINSFVATESANTEQFNERVVSMSYVSGGNRFAVIDGQLFKEGETLQNVGASVRSITPDKVLLAGKEIRQWLEVHNPTGKKLTIAKSQFEKSTVAGELATQAAEEAQQAAALVPQTATTDQPAKVMDQVNQQVEKMQNVSDVLNQLKGMF